MKASEQLKRYAAVVWRPKDLIEVRCLPQRRDDNGLPVSFWTTAEALPGERVRLDELNGDAINIFAGILPRTAQGGKSDADCLPGLTAWADFDGVEARAAWAKATDAGLPRPSMAVNSGHGSHLFWGLSERADPEDISRLVGDMAKLLDSDSTVRNPSRILRLPGFRNWKDPAVDCVLLHADPAARYAFAELRAAVPKPVSECPPNHSNERERTETREGGDLQERARRYIAEAEGANKGERNQKGFRLAAVLRNDFNLRDGDAWPLLCDWNRRNVPPLSERELRQVFDSGAKYAKHPPGGKAYEQNVDGKPARIVIPADLGEDDLSDMRLTLDAQRRGERTTIPLLWPRLSDLSNALRPGTVCILAGPPGVGKSFFVLNVAKTVHDEPKPWRYLPLEDRKTDLKFRLLAMLARDYRMIDEDTEGAAIRTEALDRYGPTLTEMLPYLCENPRVGHRDASGRTIVPPLPYGAVLDWIGKALKYGGVVFVDPISQIEFEGTESWKAEGDFIRKTIALANDSGGTVVLVAHTVKRPGKSGAAPLTLEDVQGSAMIGRLSHCALILDAHEMKTSTVYRAGGLHEEVDHNRTVLIAKARHGSGARQRLAFLQRDDAPMFRELGAIAPKGLGGRV